MALALLLRIISAVVADDFCGRGWVFNISLGGCAQLKPPPELVAQDLSWREAPLLGAWRPPCGVNPPPAPAPQSTSPPSGPVPRRPSPYLLRLMVRRVEAGRCICVVAGGVGAAVTLPRFGADAARTSVNSTYDLIMLAPPAVCKHGVHVFAPRLMAAVRGRGGVGGVRVRGSAHVCAFGAGVKLATGSGSTTSRSAHRRPGVPVPVGLKARGCMARHAADLPHSTIAEREAADEASAVGTVQLVRRMQWAQLSRPLPWLSNQLVQLPLSECTGCTGVQRRGNCAFTPPGLPGITMCRTLETALRQGRVACAHGYHYCGPAPVAAGGSPGVLPQALKLKHCDADFHASPANHARPLGPEALSSASFSLAAGRPFCLQLDASSMPPQHRSSAPTDVTSEYRYSYVLSPPQPWWRVGADGTIRGTAPREVASLPFESWGGQVLRLTLTRVALLASQSSQTEATAWGALMSSVTGGGDLKLDVVRTTIRLHVYGLRAENSSRRSEPSRNLPPAPPALLSSQHMGASRSMVHSTTNHRVAVPNLAARPTPMPLRMQTPAPTPALTLVPTLPPGQGCTCTGPRLTKACTRCSALLTAGRVDARGWANTVKYLTQHWAEPCPQDMPDAVPKKDDCPSISLLGDPVITLQPGQEFVDPGVVAIYHYGDAREFIKDASDHVRISCNSVGEVSSPMPVSSLQFTLSYTVPSAEGLWGCSRVLRSVVLADEVHNLLPHGFVWHAQQHRQQNWQRMNMKRTASPSRGATGGAAPAAAITQSCSGGRVFELCGPMCLPTCTAPDPCKTMPMCCTGKCVAKCVCDGGSVWSEDAGVCLSLEDC